MGPSLPPSSNCSGQFNRFDAERQWPEQATVEIGHLSKPVLLVPTGYPGTNKPEEPFHGHLECVEGLDWGPSKPSLRGKTFRKPLI